MNNTEDKVTQINLRDEANPKPIFISENLSPSEKEDLIYLIREYKDVFAWNYKDMPGLDLQIAMHRLNIKWMPSQSNNNDGSVLRSWKQSNQKSRSS